MPIRVPFAAVFKCRHTSWYFRREVQINGIRYEKDSAVAGSKFNLNIKDWPDLSIEDKGAYWDVIDPDFPPKTLWDHVRES